VEELIKKLNKIGDREMIFENEDFNAQDYSGGNFDDCLWMGYEEGRADLAREILADIKESK